MVRGLGRLEAVGRCQDSSCACSSFSYVPPGALLDLNHLHFKALPPELMGESMSIGIC